MENGYGLNIFHGDDAMADEQIRRQTRVMRSSGKGIYSRYCAKGNRVAKTTDAGNFEAMESEVRIRERREMIQGMSDFAQFMGEPKKEPLTCVVGFAAAAEAKSSPRQILPTARVFKTRSDGKHFLALVYKD